MKSTRALPALIALVVLGCGGGSSGPDSSTTGGSTDTAGSSGGFTGGASPADAFLGTWTGPWHETNGPERSGTMTIIVSRATPSDGVTISGTAHRSDGADGTVSGSIGASHGNWGLGMDFGGSGGAYSGDPSIAPNGHLVGPLYTPPGDGGFELNLDFDLTPVP